MRTPGVFTDKQVERLILAYLFGREDEEVPEDQIKNFLNACTHIVSTAQAIGMVADGLLLVKWDPIVGSFSFMMTADGRARAQAHWEAP